MLKFVILLVTLIFGCDSLELPPYLTKCTCDDTLPQCYMDNIIAIKPHLKDGAEGFAIPKLVPFHIDSLLVEVGKNLTFKLTNVDVYDLDTYEMPTTEWDISRYYCALTMFFNVIHVTGTYEVDGNLLALPIKGQGPMSLTVEELNCTYAYDFNLDDRNGVKYFKFHNRDFVLQHGKISIRLENLFDGDKVLGDQVNDLLNENRKDVMALLKDPVSQTVKCAIDHFFNEFGDKVPAEEMCIIPDINAFDN